MHTYLVGGAVRDRLLNRPETERDWVVVGATPEQLLQQGYRQVGRDFPVFLHPTTQEEYALARKERKAAPGYYGFQCIFDPNVTLEEDLLRRDLTINAMAINEQGQLIDPYGGQNDLEKKLLRHVSPAFVEDPVRVLRVARFAARYHHLGFQIAEETRVLMYTMVKKGELNHLIAERVWQEWQRSLEEKSPKIFISSLRNCGALATILPEIDCLFGVPNTQHYHPEIDSGIHSLMALDAASNLSTNPRVRFAALIHDLGKGMTPIAEWPTHHNHDERGVAIILALCERLRIPADYRKFAALVSRFHLVIHRLFELRPTTIVKLLEKTDAFRRPHWFEDLLVVCEADARGCGLKSNEYQQGISWRHLYRECAKLSAQPLIAQGLEGHRIKEALNQQRVECVRKILNDPSWEHYEKR